MVEVKVKKILDERERNINWLANKCNLSYNTMYNFVMQKTNAVSYDILDVVCKVLEVNIEDVLEIKRD